MSAWRRHGRFQIAETHGLLRVLRDVEIRRMKNGDIVATGTEPAFVGEELTIHTIGEKAGDLRARVVDCRPVLVDGFVRHRIRLTLADRESLPIDAVQRRGVSEAE